MKSTFSVKLPCGCEVHRTVSEEQLDGEAVTPEALTNFLDFSAKVLAFWYEERFFKEKRHRCELVSESNPSGIAPKES